MSKILFIGNITDGSGYSNASKHLVLAMDSVGLDVAYHNIQLSHNYYPLNEKLTELNNKSAHGAKIVITNLLPHLYDYDGRMKNIGIFSSETVDIHYKWIRQIRLMDEMWVPNEQMVAMTKQYNKKTYHIPFPLNEHKYTKIIKTGFISNLKSQNNHFVFLHVGEFNIRKNYETLLIAYLSKFTMFDNVTLVLKTHIDGLTDAQCYEQVNNLVQHVKKGLGLRYYPNIEILSGQYDEDFINSLHQEADCFVSASFGESCCLPAIDSLGHETPIIVPKSTGFCDYINKSACEIIDVIPTNCYHVNNPWYQNQIWYSVNIHQLQNAMYNMRYNIDGVYSRRKSYCKNYKHKLFNHYNYTTIGNKIKTLLNI